jgi:hypothetical protein
VVGMDGVRTERGGTEPILSSLNDRVLMRGLSTREKLKEFFNEQPKHGFDGRDGVKWELPFPPDIFVGGLSGSFRRGCLNISL